MRIIFFGSDDFAAVHLELLLNSHHGVVACVTQPDVRQGRGMKMVLSPIKVLAAQYNIPCLQPESLKDPHVVAQLKEYAADLLIVVAYGKILPQDILDIPKVFCMNVHGSLLPQYRGAAPVNWAVLNGDTRTGVTVQKMEQALDSGDIIAQAEMAIPHDMTADVLRAQMAQIGAKLLLDTIDHVAAGTYALKPQGTAKFTYASKMTKDMALIDWHKSSTEIYNKIRGLKPWPGTHTFIQGKMLKILGVEKIEGSGVPGTVIGLNKRGFIIACGSGALLIKDVQPEAGRAMPASSFMAGHKLTIGDSLPS